MTGTSRASSRKHEKERKLQNSAATGVFAVIVVAPALKPEANPVLLIKATLATEELHAACELRSWVLLSVKTPVAVNCTFPFTPTTVVAGVTTMDVRVAGVTVRVAVADREP